MIGIFNIDLGGGREKNSIVFKGIQQFCKRLWFHLFPPLFILFTEIFMNICRAVFIELCHIPGVPKILPNFDTYFEAVTPILLGILGFPVSQDMYTSRLSVIEIS